MLVISRITGPFNASKLLLHLLEETAGSVTLVPNQWKPVLIRTVLLRIHLHMYFVLLSCCLLIGHLPILAQYCIFAVFLKHHTARTYGIMSARALAAPESGGAAQPHSSGCINKRSCHRNTKSQSEGPKKRINHCKVYVSNLSKNVSHVDVFAFPFLSFLLSLLLTFYIVSLTYSSFHLCLFNIWV